MRKKKNEGEGAGGGEGRGGRVGGRGEGEEDGRAGGMIESRSESRNENVSHPRMGHFSVATPATPFLSGFADGHRGSNSLLK